MPVGTVGAVKALHVRDLHDEIQAQIMLGNTYHLYLRPGLDILKQAGGLHKFNEGVVFRSHIDGSKHVFTPEYVMDIQRVIGGDIIMALDECTPYPCEKPYAQKSMELTHRWLARCISYFSQTEPLYGYSQSLFPIVQGSVYRDLRMESANFIAGCEAEGNAIGGLSVGEPVEVMYEMTELVCSILPQDKPRYLMGVGTPANILESIALGVDMFDCVMPTRNGRNGMLFTSKGIMNMKNEKWKDDFSSIDDQGTTFADHQYSKAFLRHLFVAGEMLGPMIATVHNLGFYNWLVAEARKQITEGNFSSWKKMMVEQVQTRL